MILAHRKTNARLLSGAAIFTLATCGLSAAQAHQPFDIPPQSLASALNDFTAQSRQPILATPELLVGKTSRGAAGDTDPATALSRVLEGTGLTYRRSGQTFLIVQSSAIAARPALSTLAPETVTGSAVEGLTVTAQKRSEAIQDVPIAISAFSADALQAQKIEGGFDLLKAIPNVTFSKNNFSGYNFSIRGIGTKAISVASDPGVAIEFNDSPLIRNRLFEQEYFDVERVEVLRGPQGTLHGRNATAGVVNVISNKADADEFAGEMKGEVGNYHTKRLNGFVNVPLIEDVLAVRFAGSLTNREGYDYNDHTKHQINGRDLWSGRLSIGFTPSERIRADFIWERFSEDDDRSRTGKQLCHRSDGPESIGSVTGLNARARAFMSQGCQPGSMYDDGAFGTPNGLTIPFILAATDALNFGHLGTTGDYFTTDPWDLAFSEIRPLAILKAQDPYGGLVQSHDLRTISSVRDPEYRANTDLFEFNLSVDITDALSVAALTVYSQDEYYSFQDYNRFKTFPSFNDSTGLLGRDSFDPFPHLLPAANITPGGIFCDPQIGCADSVAGFDMSRAKSTQFSQEFRLQSAFDGPWNFSAGVNYTRYRTVEDYFVFFNLLTAMAMATNTLGNDHADPAWCTPLGGAAAPVGSPGTEYCNYIDPNPIESFNGEGHNYYRSQNPYTLKSSAVFGEVYWQAAPALKLTAGLRYTDDQKIFTPVPSQLLLSRNPFTGGEVQRGYPTKPNIEQHWKEFSGRIGFDWKPDVAFTDETMLYAFYSHGYKGGGANPPPIGFAEQPFFPGFPLIADLLPYPPTFKPEFVDAFEIGTKNTMLGGGLVLNVGAFYYDYADYQVSQIKDRTAINENFSAKIHGLEIESIFAPTESLRFNFSMGYQNSALKGDTQSIDLMNRTQGNPNYTVLKPFFVLPSNCVVNIAVVEAAILAMRNDDNPGTEDDSGLLSICPGSLISDRTIDPSNFPNGGIGFYAPLKGNELPNAPHWTVSLGGEYSWQPLNGWDATVRADAYWQSQSWARVYNLDPYDKLHGWFNTNLSFWLEKPEDDLKIEFYVKNVLDDTPITDTFLNSDDTALTTNIFTLDPRLIGVSIKKGF